MIFSLISLPLFFWYPIRNAIKFGQAPFAIATAFEELKCAKTDFASRWIINSEFFYNSLELDASNVWAYVINSSIIFCFGQGFMPDWVAILLKILSMFLIIISIIAIFKETRIKESNKLLYILAITYFSWIIGFIYFNISLPYSCTMHVRYIIVSMVIGIIYIGILYKNIERPLFKFLLKLLVILFNIISIFMLGYATILLILQ